MCQRVGTTKGKKYRADRSFVLKAGNLQVLQMSSTTEPSGQQARTMAGKLEVSV